MPRNGALMANEQCAGRHAAVGHWARLASPAALPLPSAAVRPPSVRRRVDSLLPRVLHRRRYRRPPVLSNAADGGGRPIGRGRCTRPYLTASNTHWCCRATRIEPDVGRVRREPLRRLSPFRSRRVLLAAQGRRALEPPPLRSQSRCGGLCINERPAVIVVSDSAGVVLDLRHRGRGRRRCASGCRRHHRTGKTTA